MSACTHAVVHATNAAHPTAAALVRVRVRVRVRVLMPVL